MKKNGLLYSLFALLMLLVSSCITDEDYRTEGMTGDALVIRMEAPSIMSRATEDGVDALNENLITQAQVLIFDNTGLRTPDGYRSFTFSQGKAEGIIASGNWKENAELFNRGADAAYDIYVVANAHAGNESLKDITTVEEFLSSVDEDADIWKYELANTGAQTYQNKRFAMSGVSEDFIPQNVENEYTLSVPMERLAVKIEVNISFNDDFKAKFDPTGFYSNVRNYATRALLRADKEDNFSDRGLAGNQADDPMATAWQKDLDACTAKLILYTYPTNWGNNVLEETFVLLNIPGNYTETEDGASTPEYKPSNYYKIPIRLGDASAHQIHRNTIYRVNVTVDRLGQPQIDIPVELQPQYEVMPWSVVNIDVDGGDLNYLEILKDEVIMKNIATTDEQYFTSSSPVTAKVTEAYYYDKYGQKQTIPTYQYSQYGISMSPDPSIAGTLEINSNIPTNNGIRYIKVEVSNEQGLTKNFTVKQYPLEYIVTVPGWYSYRTDFTVNGNVVNWESGSIRSDYEPTTNNSLFQSKIYSGNKIKMYYYDKDWWESTWTVKEGSSYSNLDNNNMYFVRITKTSDTYVLSVPAIDGDGYTESSAENNRLVAPAFMIASQLGAVQQRDFSSAKKHCNQYAEKSIAGEVYDDWRLPTEAELKIIDKYQNTSGSVIDEVLGGKYYWAASGKAYQTQKGEDGSESSAYIRCIRTVKASEPIVEDKE